MTAPARITLTGVFGVGKTTVAALVAQRLGWDAVDADDVLVRIAGKEIAVIFDEQGEAAFRQLEAEAFSELAGRKNLVVAAGGGAPVFEPTRRSMVESGLVVCLKATPETVVQRMEAKEQGRPRPMLAADNALARARRLIDQRAAVYALADFTVETDGMTPEEIAEDVVQFYEKRGDRSFNRPGRVEQLSRTPSVLPPVIDAPNPTTVIRTASGEYAALVGWGALERLGDITKRATHARRAFLISDDAVMAQWGETAVSSLREAGLEVASHTIPSGDGSKSLQQAAEVYDWLASQRAERRDVIVALGGGMVNDFSGFVAGTYLRGMPIVQAPTSLLAMVDASIGGKTAVNHAGAKNIVGLFYQPSAVVADVATLKTLPRRALIEGMGEVIKHALIRDPELLAVLEARLDDLMALEPELTTQVLARNVQIKGAVVSEDEREMGGVRELLNYGHTLGHAFEAAGGYEALLHGEAVAVGMIAAAEIGRRVGVTPAALVERQRVLIQRAGLPLKPPAGIDRARVHAALALDKKVVAGGQRWVLLEDVGRPIVTSEVPKEVVEAVLDDLLA
ncbi:MAG TPA: 3-dehydroquinate synthase [Dehalococcoidia bacterium]|nr:3-dehydroquinate synthase [Dehalococcoidia bacterium]